MKVSGLKLKTKTFAFPGIEPGAIVEYKWKEVISDSSANNMRLQFQRDIPVQSITYRFKPSGNPNFDVRHFNMAKFGFQKEKGGFQITTVDKDAGFSRRADDAAGRQCSGVGHGPVLWPVFAFFSLSVFGQRGFITASRSL